MKRHLTFLLAVVLTLAATLTAFAGPIELRLKDGVRWRGQVADVVKLTFMQGGVPVEFQGRIVEDAKLFLTVEGKGLSGTERKVIFKSDITAISTVEAGTSALPAPAAKPGAAPVTETVGPTESGDDEATLDKNAKRADRKPGVFVLPLSGTVGVEFRHEEMLKVAKEADKFGSGQIIVLLIDSGGGSVVEMEKIHETLTDIRKKHRLVAWIRSAISAACATALHCHEIYFTTEGTAGSMTAFGGGVSLTGEELERWLQGAGDWAEAGGRSRYMAEAMIHAPKLLSYDKDPVTGKVTWLNDLSGQYILSRETENLTFNSSNAVHCGFADGIADTEADLARLLDLPEWHELSSVGRDAAEEWNNIVKRANEELPKLAKQLDYKNTGTGDQRVIIGTRIRIYEQLIRWSERAPNPYQRSGLPPKSELERRVTELKKQLADMRKK
jgi:hypothetical protein